MNFKNLVSAVAVSAAAAATFNAAPQHTPCNTMPLMGGIAYAADNGNTAERFSALVGSKLKTVRRMTGGVLPQDWLRYGDVCDEFEALYEDGIITVDEFKDAQEYMLATGGMLIYPVSDTMDYMEKMAAAKRAAHDENSCAFELSEILRQGVQTRKQLDFDAQVYRCVRTHAARLFASIYGLTVDPYDVGVWHKKAASGFRSCVCDASGVGTEKELVFFCVAEADGYKWTKKGSTTKYTLTDTAPAKGWTCGGACKVAATLRVHLQSRLTTERDTDVLVNDRNENCHDVPRTFVEIVETYSNDVPDVPTGYSDTPTGYSETAGNVEHADTWSVYNMVWLDDNNIAAKEGSQWGVSMLSHLDGQPIATKYIGTANRYNYEEVITAPADVSERCLMCMRGRVVVDAYDAEYIDDVDLAVAAIANHFTYDACEYYDLQLGTTCGAGWFKVFFSVLNGGWTPSDFQLTLAKINDMQYNMRKCFCCDNVYYNAADREFYAVLYARFQMYKDILNYNDGAHRPWAELKQMGRNDYDAYWRDAD